ncbi:hypothetical protein OXX69_012957 [Metschnikowia pulcherrima]
MPVPEPSASSVTILYGSETGNAQDYAYYLARKLRYNSLHPTVSALNDYAPKKIGHGNAFLDRGVLNHGPGRVAPKRETFFTTLTQEKTPA